MSRRQRACRQPHGTYTRYAAGCSCIPCCDAWARYHMERKRGERIGNVSPDGTRAHLVRLRRKMTLTAIAKASGKSVGVLRAILLGEREYIREETAKAVLGVQPAGPSSGSSLVDYRPSARLITAMRERDHTLTEISEITGLAWRHLYAIELGYRGKQWVQARVAKRVLEAALELGVIRQREDAPALVLRPDVVDQVVGAKGWEPAAVMSAAGVTADVYQQIRRGVPVGEDRAERIAFELDVDVEKLFEAVA